jgi:OOP family OmpA-OmpF porin
MDLFDLLKTQLTETALGALASSLGETPAATRKAVVSGAAPAVLAGVLQNFGGDSGAGRLLEILQAGRHDGSLFDNLGGALGGGAQTDTLVNAGKGLLGGLLGDKAGAVGDLLANFAGVRRSSAGSLLSLAAPLLLGAIGKLGAAAPGGLSAGGVGSLLATAKTALGSEAPPGLAAALGVADLNSLGAAAGERKTMVYPWLLVPIVALILFGVLRSCSQKPAEAIPASQGQVVAPIPAADPVPAAAEPKSAE